MMTLIGPTWPSQTDSCFPSSENRSMLPSRLAVKILPPKPWSVGMLCGMMLATTVVLTLTIWRRKKRKGMLDTCDSCGHSADENTDRLQHWKKKPNALTKGPPLIVTKPILSGHTRTNDSCPKKRLAQPRSVRCRGHSGQHHLDIKTPRFRRARPLQRHPDPGSATVEHPDKPLHRSQRTHGSSLRCGKLDIGVSNMRLLIR